MRRIVTRFITIVMIIGMFTAGVFAESGLTLVERYPEDGQSGTSVENLGVKLTFNNPVNSEANKAFNDACFSLVNEDGETLPIKVYYNSKETNQVLVLYDSTASSETGTSIKGNTEYTVTIKGDFIDNAGNTLGEDETITFKTLNQQLNTRVYMVMMVAMMVGMVFFSTRQANRNIDKEEAAELAAARNENFNPYKEAKRTGKSVEEIVAQHEKEVAKREARAAKLASRQAQVEDDEEEEEISGNYKVGRPRTVASGGSTYITGRKAAAEARKAEEERLAKRRAAAKKKKK